MTEADLLAQLQTSRYNIAFFASQIIAIHFALIVGIYYFLHKSFIILKLIAHILYTVGFIALLGPFIWESNHIRAISEELLRKQSEGTLSAVGRSLLSENALFTIVQYASPWIVFCGAWIMITITLFFRRSWDPKDEGQQ